MKNRAKTAARRPKGRRAKKDFQVLLVTGMSGAGKSSALKALEDLGFETVDNAPLRLLNALVPTRGRAGARPLAVGVDIRTRDFGAEMFLAGLARLSRRRGLSVALLFMDCDDETLRRRYAETRHRHPLAEDRPLADGIRHERRLLMPLQARADLSIDTTDMAPADLKRVLAGHFGIDDQPAPAVFVTSFAYRKGLPREADLVFDARFLTNPHYDVRFRPLSGLDRPVRAFVRRDPGYRRFLADIARLLKPLLPRFAAEGKSYLTVAVGCTGGRHRSVVVAEALGTWFRERGALVQVRHRDLESAPESAHNRRPARGKRR